MVFRTHRDIVRGRLQRLLVLFYISRSTRVFDYSRPITWPACIAKVYKGPCEKCLSRHRL